MLRGFHALLGWAALVLATVHELAVISLSRAHPPRWLLGELVIGLSIQLPAVWMIHSARRPPQPAFSCRPASSAAVLASAWLLFIVSLVQLIEFHVAFPALFAALAIVDGAA